MNLRMVDTYGNPFLLHWPSGAAAWHYPGDHPHLVREPHDCRRNHSRRPLARAPLASGAPQTRWSATDPASLADLIVRVSSFVRLAEFVNAPVSGLLATA